MRNVMKGRSFTVKEMSKKPLGVYRQMSLTCWSTAADQRTYDDDDDDGGGGGVGGSGGGDLQACHAWPFNAPWPDASPSLQFIYDASRCERPRWDRDVPIARPRLVRPRAVTQRSVAMVEQRSVRPRWGQCGSKVCEPGREASQSTVTTYVTSRWRGQTFHADRDRDRGLFSRTLTTLFYTASKTSEPYTTDWIAKRRV